MDNSPPAIIERLKLLPALLELKNHTDVAAAIGVSYKTWNHTVHTGDMSYNTAKAIVKALPGMDLDWLTWGTECGLSVQMARKIAQMRNA
jgi:hypothetical protein